MFNSGDRVSIRISDLDAKVLNAIISYYSACEAVPIRFRSKTEVIQMAFVMAGSRLEKEGYLTLP